MNTFNGEGKTSLKNYAHKHRISVSRKSSFCAAHFLRDYNGACASMHGHTWHYRVTITGYVNDISCDMPQERIGAPNSMLLDFKVLKGWMREFEDMVDHKVLNNVEGINAASNPTAEFLCIFIAEMMKTKLNNYKHRGHVHASSYVSEVSVWESEDSKATWKGE